MQAISAVTISIAANMIYDGLKAAGGALNEHCSRQSTAVRDNPSGRGRGNGGHVGCISGMLNSC